MNQPPPAGTQWYGTAIGIGALGVVMVAYYAFYWGILGLWTPNPLLWLLVLLMGVPLVLVGAGMLLLRRRKRAGFWLVAAGLAWLLVIGFNETWVATSALLSQLILAAGTGAAIYGSFATRRR